MKTLGSHVGKTDGGEGDDDDKQTAKVNSVGLHRTLNASKIYSIIMLLGHLS